MTKGITDFQETEIGPVPVEWDVVPLRDVTEKRQTRDPRKTPDGTFKYIDVSSVSNETYRVQGWKEHRGHEAPSRARKVVKARDTIFATVRPYLRNIAQVPSHLDNEICSTGFCVIRPKPGKADPDYLFYIALSDAFVARIVAQQRGSSYPAVSDKVVLSELIPLPPLPEQRRIAHVLSTIQRAVAAQDDLIAAAREVKRSLMQRLFTYGPGPEPAPIRETEIGVMPAHWEVCPLGDLLAINLRNGIYKPRNLYGKGHIRIVQLNDIYSRDARIRPHQLDTVDVTDAEWEKYKIIDGDLIVNRVSKREEGVGAVALVEPSDLPTVFESNMFRLRLDQSRILREYFLQYGQSDIYHRQVMLRATKANQTSINQGSLRAIPVPIPRLNIQQTVAKRLNAADRKIAAEEQRKAALQALFKAMLHQLMTGQLRLPKSEQGETP